jgi:hypothetical protein
MLSGNIRFSQQSPTGCYIGSTSAPTQYLQLGSRLRLLLVGASVPSVGLLRVLLLLSAPLGSGTQAGCLRPRSRPRPLANTAAQLCAAECWCSNTLRLLAAETLQTHVAPHRKFVQRLIVPR